MAVIRLKSVRGSGMVIAFFALMLISALGISFLSLTSSSLVTSKRDVMRTRAIACAEAGVEQAATFLLTEGPDEKDQGTWRTNHPDKANPNNHSGDTWYSASLAPDERYQVCVRDGSGKTAGKIIITSVGIVREGTRTVTRTIKVVAEYNQENVNVWNNVIFGGVGQAGRSINGNVAMRGSIHLLGDGEEFTDTDNDGHWDDGAELSTWNDADLDGEKDPGEWWDKDGDGRCDAKEPFKDVNGNGTRDPALTVTDLANEVSGTASVGNNYTGMSNDLMSRLPSLETEVFGGETVESLDAKLRVKHGRVNVSGSATVGDSNITGNSVKETMDGTYVNDGWGGNKGSASVNSDNGFSKGYDLGDGLVEMPVIDSQGGPYTDKYGTVYSSYLEYMKANATVYTGDLYIEGNVATTISGPNGTLTIDGAGNMTISGIVYVTGKIEIGLNNKNLITYNGNGTLVTPGSAYVHCNLLPQTNFPLNDVLGLVAGDRVELATGAGDAQLTMAIAMYAQHKVISMKQSEIAGTVVSSYFEMSNVPHIFQVPELTKHLPPGMPGGDPIWIKSLDIQGWQEI